MAILHIALVIAPEIVTGRPRSAADSNLSASRRLTLM